MTELHSLRQMRLAFQQRVLVAALIMLLGFGGLVGRFYYLQIVRFDYYHARAEGNRIALLPIVPARGVITDRNGAILARNYSAYTLEINPSQVKDFENTFARLTTIIPISDSDKRRFFNLAKETKYFDSIPVRSHLSEKEVAIVAARRYRFPGIEVQERHFRDYPHGEILAHVVGYIARINDDDLQRFEKEGSTANYRGSEYVGKSGLERSYESELHGQTGYEKVEINASGRAVRLLSRWPASPGRDLILTLDAELQRAADEALGSVRGAVVAIDPSNGEILALVSKPAFDPNLFVEGISHADWRELNESADHPMLNRSIYSAYPPGSTFKPFMALAGLETGRRTLEQRFDHQGWYKFAGQRYQDRKWRCQHGVDLHRSLVFSCNVYYYTLANDLGINALSGFMQQFGFGSKTNIDIPGETAGVLPTPAWKRSRFREKEHQVWYGGETLSVGIGQGYNAYTPLQMASAVATLANGGIRYRPHLVKSFSDSKEGVHSAQDSAVSARLGFKAQYLEAIRNAMIEVTRVGTAAKAFADVGYEVAGKTGTAQLFSLRGQRYDANALDERLRDHGWFIGFAPAQSPTIALAVLIENGGSGALAAAPVARQVFDHYLLKQALEIPEDGFEEFNGQSAHTNMPALKAVGG